MKALYNSQLCSIYNYIHHIRTFFILSLILIKASLIQKDNCYRLFLFKKENFGTD